MKKLLLALAVLEAFAGTAQAQNAVTIYGSFDGGIRYLSDVNAAGDNRWTMGSNGTYNSNRIGFKGAEDLGSGLNAHFALESGFNTGTGTLDNATTRLFNRSAFVGLGGTWGSLDLGRQYSINFKTIGTYDPFSYKYTSIIPLAAQGGLPRLDNDIQYTGKFGPVTAQAEYVLGEVPGSARNGSAAAVGATFANGPFTVGGAYTNRKNNVLTGTAPASFQTQKNWTIGGAFSTGPFRVAVGYADNKQEQITPTADTRVKDAWIGGNYNLTPAAQLSAAYYRTKVGSAAGDGRRNLYVIGMTYALSKRTNFYTDIDRANYSGIGRTVALALPGSSAAGQDRQTGLSLGINHLF